MNVLHINTERTWRGGEQQTLSLAEGLKTRGHRSTIACPPGTALETRARERGVAVHPIPMRAEWDLLAALRLARLVRALSSDIVHMHTSHAHSIGVLAVRLARRPARTVVARRVDFSIYRHALSLSGLKYRFGVDRYVAVSRAIKEQLVRDGIEPARIEVVHSGIDLGRFDGRSGDGVRRELGIPGNAPVVGTVAHFAWHKGLEYLIDAVPLLVREVPGMTVVIVGEGSLQDQIRQRAAAGGAAPHVVFAGFRADVPACLALFDVFVMPSVMEGLCTSILDALAALKPVVGTTAGGIPEIIEDGRTGLLVPPRDPQALAAAVLRLLREPELGRELARQGRDKVAREFSIDAMVDGNLAVYDRLLAGGPQKKKA